MGMIDDSTRLPKICRNCFYRRSIKARGMSFYYGKSRLDSFCAYFTIEEEIRGCTPTDGECARFKPRKSKKE